MPSSPPLLRVLRRERTMRVCMLTCSRVSQDNHVSTSAYVAFPFHSCGDGESGVGGRVGEALRSGRVEAVVWTTTPWTLPANVAICVHPALEYSVVEVRGGAVSCTCASPMVYSPPRHRRRVCRLYLCLSVLPCLVPHDVWCCPMQYGGMSRQFLVSSDRIGELTRVLDAAAGSPAGACSRWGDMCLARVWHVSGTCQHVCDTRVTN